VSIELKQVGVTGGRQVVETYGAGGFRISGVEFRGSVLVLPDRSLDWPVRTVSDMSEASFAEVMGAEGAVEILLLGTGRRMQAVPASLRLALKRSGIMLEAMDTGAACRTYNVLIAEDRRVAAALIKPE
jgi:uncharacterized protein